MKEQSKAPPIVFGPEEFHWKEAYEPLGDLLREVERRLKKRESFETLAMYFSSFPGDKVLEEIENYILQAGGKRMRAALCLLSAGACGGDMRQAIPLAVGVELFHAATLVLDDLVEDADTRRGRPAVHKTWGDPGALVAALGLQLRSLPAFVNSMMTAGKNSNLAASSKMISMVGQTVARVLWGEINQHRTRLKYETREEIYLRIISDKTAALFEMCCVGGALVAGADLKFGKAMENYANRLGMAFQIADDLLDLKGEKKRLGKSPGSDLKEGRATLPLIYFFRDANRNQRERMKKMLPPRRRPPLPLEQIVGELDRAGSIEQCRKVARKLSVNARRALSRLPETKAKNSLRILAMLAADRTR